MYSKLTMDEVTVDVIIDRRRAYGLAGSKPFHARIANTSSFLGCGHSYWEVNDGFTAPEKRIIARAIWKAMDEKNRIRLYKRWTVKDSYGFKCRKDTIIDLPGRK